MANALEGADDEDEGEEGEEQSYLLFSSENWRWPSWMPGLHLEVIRRRGVVDEPPVSNTQASRWAIPIARQRSPPA